MDRQVKPAYYGIRMRGLFGETLLAGSAGLETKAEDGLRL